MAGKGQEQLLSYTQDKRSRYHTAASPGLLCPATSHVQHYRAQSWVWRKKDILEIEWSYSLILGKASQLIEQYRVHSSKWEKQYRTVPNIRPSKISELNLKYMISSFHLLLDKHKACRAQTMFIFSYLSGNCTTRSRITFECRSWFHGPSMYLETHVFK